MTVNNRRAIKVQTRQRRFVIVAQVSFSWRSRSGVLHQAEGATRDISSHGVFICTQQMPAAGAVVEVEVAVGLSEDRGTITRLRGTGTVVRTDSTYGQSVGFAAAVKFAVADMRASSNP
jgi:hypothetical protein